MSFHVCGRYHRTQTKGQLRPSPGTVATYGTMGEPFGFHGEKWHPYNDGQRHIDSAVRTPQEAARWCVQLSLAWLISHWDEIPQHEDTSDKWKSLSWIEEKDLEEYCKEYGATKLIDGREQVAAFLYRTGKTIYLPTTNHRRGEFNLNTEVVCRWKTAQIIKALEHFGTSYLFLDQAHVSYKNSISNTLVAGTQAVQCVQWVDQMASILQEVKKEIPKLSVVLNVMRPPILEYHRHMEQCLLRWLAYPEVFAGVMCETYWAWGGTNNLGTEFADPIWYWEMADRLRQQKKAVWYHVNKSGEGYYTEQEAYCRWLWVQLVSMRSQEQDFTGWYIGWEKSFETTKVWPWERFNVLGCPFGSLESSKEGSVYRRHFSTGQTIVYEVKDGPDGIYVV